MLELILNAAWLSVGVFLAFRLGVPQQDRSRFAVRAIALFCLLLVLFPVISLSDDLHRPEAALSDVTRSGDQGSSNSSTVDHNSTVAVALATSATAIHLQFLHFAEPAQRYNNRADAAFLSSDALRAPPAAL
jgi:hypothetical protein